MIFMHVLKLLVDLSFYFTFTVPVCAHYGGLSYCIAIIPAAAYILYLICKREFPLSLGRQRRVFLTYCKVTPVFLGAMVIGRANDAVMTAVPFVMITLTASLLLMRSLRHDKQIFSKGGYQMFNVCSIALVIVMAFVCSSKTVLHGCVAVLGGVYQNLIAPVLFIMVQLLGMFFSVVSKFFPGFGEWEQKAEVEEIVSGAFETQIDESWWADATQENGFVLTVIAGAAFAVTIVFFFKWLGSRISEKQAGMHNNYAQNTMPRIEQVELKKDVPALRSVRGIYRRFLKLCKVKGMELRDGDTTMDVERRAKSYFETDASIEEMRKIYIRHRYGGEVIESDRHKMKQLYKNIKKK